MSKQTPKERIEKLEQALDEAVHEAANLTRHPQSVARLRALAQQWCLVLHEGRTV